MKTIQSKLSEFWKQISALPRWVLPLVALSSLVMSVALSININPATKTNVQFLGFRWMLYSLLITLPVTLCTILQFQSRHLNKPYRRYYLAALVLSLTYAGFLIMGQSLQASSSFLPLYQSAMHLSCTFLRYLGITLFFFCTLALLFKLCKLVHCDTEEHPLLLFRGHEGLAYSLIIAIVWLVWLMAFWPGAIPTDTARQLAQYFGTGGIKLTNHFPFFVSVVFGSIYSLGMEVTGSCALSIAMLSLFQIALGSIVFGTLMKWIGKLGAPRWVTLGGIVFCAAFPLYSSHALTISKDFLHACFLSLFALQILLSCIYRNRKDRPALSAWPAIAIVAILVSLTRNNGVYIAIPSLLILAAFERDIRGYIALAGALASVVLWNSAFLPLCGVSPGERSEMLSIPSQIVGRALSERQELTDSERSVLEESFNLDLDVLADAYDPMLSDYIKNAIRTNENLDLLAYLKTATSIALRHPGGAIAAAMNTTYGYWYPLDLGTYWQTEGAPYWCGADDTYGLTGTWFADHELIEQWSTRTSGVVSLLQNLRINSTVMTFLYRPGTYSWIILFAMGYAYATKRNLLIVAMTLLPFFLLIATLLAGPCSSIRYSLPIIFSLPLFLLLIFGRLSPESTCDLRKDS